MKPNITFENLNNMPFVEKGNHSKIFKCLVWLTLLSYAFACFMSFYKKAVYSELLIEYIWIPAFAVIAASLLKGTFFQRKAYIACLLFLAWMLATFYMKDVAPVSDPTNQTFIIARCILCCIAIPFVHIMDDADHRKHLNSFLYLFVIITALLLWLSYIGALRGESFSFFDGRFLFGATYTYTDRMMLQFFNLYYYKTGYLALIGFFTTLYLAVSHWSKRRSILFIALFITFITAVVITYSRTAVFTCLIGLLIALYILLQQLNINQSTRRIIIALSTLAGTVLAAAGLNYTYRFFNSIRDIWYGIDTLSSRTDIWISVVDVIKDQPQVLLHGLPIRESMGIMNAYIDLTDKVSNMHSGYIQTLILVGLPGLLAVLVFCIYLTAAMGKILFSNTVGNREATSIKFMIIIPVCLMVMNIFESLICFNPVQTDIMNLIFALFAGYIIEYAYHHN